MGMGLTNEGDVERDARYSDRRITHVETKPNSVPATSDISKERRRV